MTYHLLYLGPDDLVDHVRSILPATYEIQQATDASTAYRYLPNSDVVLDAYMKIHFRKDQLDRAGRLKLFVTATTGADHVDAAVLEKRKIPLLTLRGQKEILKNITPAAEHSWLLLMACARQLLPATQHVLQGKWDRNEFPGMMLRGKTIGIIGCGRIGEWISRYAAAFGMKCLGFDPYADPFPSEIEKTDLSILLQQSDFISIHVTLTDETRGLLGPKEFQKIKKGAVLVNSSRGEVVDETSLLRALENSDLQASGLDVLTGEPEIDRHPLVRYARTHSNLILTPHIGGYSPDALKTVLTFSCKRINDFFGT